MSTNKSATVIRRVIEFFIAISIVGLAITLFRAIASAVTGSFGTLHWTVSRDVPVVQALGDNGEIGWSHGKISLSGLPIAHGIELLVSLAVPILFILALLGLRRLLLALSAGEIFTDANIGALRRIGSMLIAIAAISIANALIIQPVILSAASMPEGFALHPSISWNIDGVSNIWLEYDVPVFTFVLGGLALLAAAAFRSGQQWQQDSESVV